MTHEMGMQNIISFIVIDHSTVTCAEWNEKENRIDWYLSGFYVVFNFFSLLSALHSIRFDFIFSFMWFMIKVTFGEHDRCDDKTRPETRFVLRAISQPFSFSNFDNDVALLRLNDRVPITDFIRPICLPSKKCMHNFFLIVF